MSGGGGAGAVAYTQQFMRQMNREMEKLAARRAARSAFRAAVAHSRFKVDPGPTRVEYPCYYLCTTCGYLKLSKRESCPHCQGQDYFDLGDLDIGWFLQSEEAALRMEEPFILKFIVRLACLILAFIGCVVSMYYLQEWGLLLSLLIIIAAVLIYTHVTRPLAVLLRRLCRQKRPKRWYMPVVKVKKRVVKNQLSATVTAPLVLTAPFSRVPCLAYKICVRFDAEKDARPPEWVLAETHNVEMTIGGKTIAEDRVILEKPLEPISEDAFSSSGGKMETFLRARGLFIEDGEFELFETVVRDGDIVTARFIEASDVVLVN